MNRRDLLKSGFLALGGMAIPLNKVFAMSNLAALTDPKTSTVSQSLVAATGKQLKDITEADLLEIRMLNLPHIHINKFFENDFEGLTNLKELKIRSIFHTQPGFPEKVFRGLDGLERLTSDFNQFTAMPDDVFSPLDNLQVLDLGDSEFDRLPRSIFELKNVKTIFASGLTGPQLQDLKNQYGSIVQS